MTRCVNCESEFEGRDEFCPKCAAELDAYLLSMADEPERDEYEEELMSLEDEAFEAAEKMAPGLGGMAITPWVRKPKRNTK